MTNRTPTAAQAGWLLAAASVPGLKLVDG